MTNDYLSQLTHKNRDFINVATHQFIKDGKSDQEIHDILEEVLPVILENQKQGITARRLLGAPSVWAAEKTKTSVPTASKSDENDSPFLMWLESALFLLGVLAIVNGIINFFSKQEQTYGILTFIAMSAAGGVVLYLMYHFVYNNLNKPKEERSSMYKTWGIFGVSVLVWIVLFTLSMMLPTFLNPTLPPLATLILGVVVIAIRYFLKKQFNIKSTFQSAERNK